jgi:hypothetical protein
MLLLNPNLTYDPRNWLTSVTTYDSIASGKKGKGRLTKMQAQSGTTEFVYVEAMG